MPELKLSDKKNYMTFFHIKNQVPTESNRCFSLVICGVGRGVSRRRDWGIVFYVVKIYLAGGLMLNKKLLPYMLPVIRICCFRKNYHSNV